MRGVDIKLLQKIPELYAGRQRVIDGISLEIGWNGAELPTV
jgi:hypothetical protein